MFTTRARLIYLLLWNIFFSPSCAIRRLFLQQKRNFRKLNSIFQFSICRSCDGKIEQISITQTTLLLYWHACYLKWDVYDQPLKRKTTAFLVKNVRASVVAYHETSFWFPLFVRVCASPPPSKPPHADYSLIYDSVLKKCPLAVIIYIHYLQLGPMRVIWSAADSARCCCVCLVHLIGGDKNLEELSPAASFTWRGQTRGCQRPSFLG